MTSPEEQPELLFFRSRPHNLVGRSPLASSLQSFESCLLLVALHRYPHAFTACVLAIESGLKSAFGHSPADRITLENLVDQACSRSHVFRSFSPDSLDNMRKTRNRFIHYGFSPKDDGRSAEILLRTGLPFLRTTYANLLEFSLDNALLPKFAGQINLALQSFQENAYVHGSSPIAFLAVLGHLVRWSVKDSLSASWELEAADEAERVGTKFDVIQMRKRKAETQLEPCWSFDCPICHGIETLVCQLDESDLRQRRVTVLRAFCVECDLVVPLNAPGLAHSVCKEQVSVQEDNILKDYGFL